MALSLNLRRASNVYHIIDKGEANIKHTGRPRLHITPGDEKTAWAANSLSGRTASRLTLKRVLAPVEHNFNVIVIDTPPGISPLTEATMHTATHARLLHPLNDRSPLRVQKRAPHAGLENPALTWLIDLDPKFWGIADELEQKGTPF